MKRLFGLLVLAGMAAAQTRTIPPGTTIPVRTNEPISTKDSDGRVFTGIVNQDVVDSNGRVVIPRGAPAEMMVRRISDREVALDLEAITVNGRQYAVAADTTTVGKAKRAGLGKNKRTAKFVGGGGLFGTVVGAIAGGGKGALVGGLLGAGAGAGAQALTRGKSVNVPAESVVTFRLEQPMTLVAANPRPYRRQAQ